MHDGILVCQVSNENNDLAAEIFQLYTLLEILFDITEKEGKRFEKNTVALDYFLCECHVNMKDCVETFEYVE